MLWLCPPTAELRRLPAARGLLATAWHSVSRAPGAEAGWLSLDAAQEGLAPAEVAVSVDSRVYPDAADFPDLGEGISAALAKLLAIGVQPAALHVVIHADTPQGTAARDGLRAAIESLSARAREREVATLGAEICLDPEYGETLLVDTVALGWRGSGDRADSSRVPSVGDSLLAIAGQDLFGIRSELSRAAVSFAGIPTSSDVPLRAVIAAIGELGLELGPAAIDPDHPEAGLERMRPNPTRSFLVVASQEDVPRISQIAVTRGAMVAELGRVTADSTISVVDGGGGAVRLPASAVREPLVVPSEYPEPDEAEALADLRLEDLPEPEDYEEAFRRMMRAPKLASRKMLYERFDSWFGGATVLHPGAGSGVAALRDPHSGSLIAVATSGNPRFCALDPYVGFCIAVCEGVRRLATRGARPAALVGGASFGAGQDPGVAQRGEQGLAGLRDAAQAFSLPCLALTTSPAGPDEHPPTPVTPGLALLGRLSGSPVTQWFKQEGHAIVLLGRSREEIAGSEYAAWIHGTEGGSPPWVDFGAERAVSDALTEAIDRNLLKSARNVGPGGLAFAILNACCSTPASQAPMGARILVDEGIRPDAWLFAESQARVVVSVARENLAELREIAQERELPFLEVGEVGGRLLEFGTLVGLPLDEVLDIWNGALAERLGGF